MQNTNNYRKAAQAIKTADALIITSGAGMGVDSGLPDFRGDEGFWEAYPPIAKMGYSFIEMANPQWFKSKPELAWAFYGHRFNLYRDTIPHKGFQQLLEMGQGTTKGYFLFTSNVDGQFQKAGFSEDKIAEVHGSIHHFQCVDRCTNNIWKAPDKNIDLDEEVFEAFVPFPSCPECGGLARPNILMFGDWGWISDRSSEQENRLQKFLREFSKDNNVVVIETGAGSALPTVRRFSESVSRKAESPLIRINPRDSHLGRSSKDSLSFSEGAASGIENIFTEYKKL